VWDPEWGYDPQIQTRARFLYNAPNRQVSSFGSYRVDKQTHWQANKQTPLKTSISLCYATSVGNKVVSTETVNNFKNCLYKFWAGQQVLPVYDYNADLHDIGNCSIIL